MYQFRSIVLREKKSFAFEHTVKSLDGLEYIQSKNLLLIISLNPWIV